MNPATKRFLLVALKTLFIIALLIPVSPAIPAKLVVSLICITISAIMAEPIIPQA